MVKFPLEVAAGTPVLRQAGLLAAASIFGLISSSVFAATANTPVGVLQATPASLQGVVDTIPLASHRAVYDLTLLKAVGTKSPTGARGRTAS
jgi:hypothetical protein